MPISGPEILLYEKDGPIVTITLNREERLNAISIELFHRIDEALLRFDDDPKARVAIITGAGQRSFSAGVDLKEQGGADQTGPRPLMGDRWSGRMRPRSMAWTGERGLEVWKPTIAAVNGYALAGGWALSQACDIRIAAEHAEFGITEAKWARTTSWTVPLLWMLPLGISLELIFTGERISAQRLYELGYVNKVVPSAELMSTAREMAKKIAENAPLTLRAAKETMYRAMDVGREAGIILGSHIFYRAAHSDDVLEGNKAFAEKRKPVWSGDEYEPT